MQTAPGRAGLFPIPLLVTLAVCVSTPLWLSRVGLYQYLALEIMIWMLFALGYNLLLGTTGLPSFGHGAYFGIGAYAFGLLQHRLWANLWFDLAGAVLAAALLGALVALFISHRRGIYYALLTIAFGQVFWFVVDQVARRHRRRGRAAQHQAAAGGIRLRLDQPARATKRCSISALALFALAVVALWRLVHSPLGRVLQRDQAERDPRGLRRLQRLALQVAGVHHLGRRRRAWRARCSPWRSSRPTPT